MKLVHLEQPERCVCCDEQRHLLVEIVGETVYLCPACTQKAAALTDGLFSSPPP